MLVSDRLIGKLQRSLERYKEKIFLKVADLDVRYLETDAHLRTPPEAREAATRGMSWGRIGGNAWFVSEFTVPNGLEEQALFLTAETGGSESLVFVDGEPMGALDSYSNALEATNANDDGPIGYAVVKGHATRLLCRKAKAGQVLRIAIESYAGHANPGCHPHCLTHEESTDPKHFVHAFQGISIRVEQSAYKEFVYDLLPLLQLVEILPEDSLRKAKICQGLERLYSTIPQLPDEHSEEDLLAAMAEGRELMKPLLAAKNGTTAPWMGLIGHSHMDTAWLWPVRETIRKCARTFAAALEMTDSYDEFMWLQTCPVHSEFIKDNYPGLFERLRGAVEKGAWEINGGTYVEPDCNIPCGEALVRNFLIGDLMNREMFGRRSNCFWQPDVFGYSAALPQIMKGVGIDYFLTTKLSWNDTNRFPYDTFIWRGMDGSEVVSHFNVTHCRPDPLTLDKSWKDLKHKDLQDRRLVAYGLGDGGSGVQFQMLETARRVKDLEGCPRSEYTKLGVFMTQLDEELSGGLPTWNGELYLELHRGVLTTQADLKKGNRKAELLLRQAEWICATNSALGNVEYPKEELQRNWKKLLLNQFHDILPGTSIAQVHIEAKADLDTICDESFALSGRGSAGKSDTISIVNTRSWNRDTFLLEDFPEGESLEGEGLTTQAYQNVEGANCLLVKGVELAPMSSKQFSVSKDTDVGASVFEWEEPILKTPLAEVRFGEAGEVLSYIDRENCKEWVPEGGAWNQFSMCDDVPKLWDNWDLDAEDAKLFETVGKVVSREVVAEGPLLFRLEQVIELTAKTKVRQVCSVEASGGVLSFETQLDWGESHRFLKTRFDAPVRSDQAKHEIQYGFVERPTHTNTEYDGARFEHCNHRWSDLSDGRNGIAVFNDAKYGVSTRESSISLSLMKGGTHPDHRGSAGRHFFSYAVKPHACSFSVTEVGQPAQDFNDIDFWIHGETSLGEESFIRMSEANVSIDWVKEAEDGSGLIVRLYEMEGAATESRFTLPEGDWEAFETNLLEEIQEELEATDGELQLGFRGFEVKTLLLKRR